MDVLVIDFEVTASTRSISLADCTSTVLNGKECIKIIQSQPIFCQFLSPGPIWVRGSIESLLSENVIALGQVAPSTSGARRFA